MAAWLVVGALAWTRSELAVAWTAGTIAAAATTVGALPALGTTRLPRRLTDGFYGFGAGVMLAAACFALVLPAVEMGTQRHGVWPGGLGVAAAVVLGAAAIAALEHVVPHEHFIKHESRAHATQLRRIWLFVLAIALHNLPEGLAIGVTASGQSVDTMAVTVGIALQDAPEGLVVALALLHVGYSRARAVTVAALTGIVEPIGAVLGASAVLLTQGLLPWALALAGGAMLFVVSHEIIPESHRQGHERHATAGLILGFAVMLVLETTLG